MKLLKNPLFWAFIGLLGGMIIAGWGWDKYTSTIAERTKGGLFMMITGSAMIVTGLLIMFTYGAKGGRK